MFGYREDFFPCLNSTCILLSEGCKYFVAGIKIKVFDSYSWQASRKGWLASFVVLRALKVLCRRQENSYSENFLNFGS
jgi:hypothetical protein